MPELGMPKNEFIGEVRRCVAEKYCNLWPWEIQEIAERNDQEVINSGEECVVVPGKDGSKETVVAYTYFDLNPLRAKELFYSQRIYSTLFPNNFPKFYAAFGASKEGDKPTGTIRQKINYSDKAEVIYPFQQVVNVCNEIGLPLMYQPSPDNLVVGENGGEYYLDTTPQFPPEAVNREKLFEYMIKSGYSQVDVRIIELSLLRIEEVYKEAARQREERAENSK